MGGDSGMIVERAAIARAPSERDGLAQPRRPWHGTLVSTPPSDASGRAGKAFPLLREPTVQFFVLGALLFAGHRLVVGNPRVIVVGSGLRADLQRRLRDQTGRQPSPAELAAALAGWKRDEALYREALRERLDRDDPTVRAVLADKMRARAVREMEKREPSDAELRGYLDSHRAAYEVPVRYAFESVSFARGERNAQEARASYQRALATGAKPASLGRPILSGSLTREELGEKFGAVLADAMCGLPVGSWQALASDDSLLLVRISGKQGGLPAWDVLRPRLASDWDLAAKQEAVDSMARAVVGRYRFEEVP